MFIDLIIFREGLRFCVDEATIYDTCYSSEKHFELRKLDRA